MVFRSNTCSLWYPVHYHCPITYHTIVFGSIFFSAGVTDYFCVVWSFHVHVQNYWTNLMFIGPCIIAIVDDWKTNLMSFAILFHLLCAQRVSDINISILGNLRLRWWITTSVVLFSVCCVLELLLRLVFGGVRFAGWSLQIWAHNKRNEIKEQVTSSWSFIRRLLQWCTVQ